MQHNVYKYGLDTASVPGRDVTIVANRPQCDLDHDMPR